MLCVVADDALGASGQQQQGYAALAPHDDRVPVSPGSRLELGEGMPWLFALGFFVVLSILKAGSVYGGARLAGKSPAVSAALAAALNVRGSTGIIVAALAFDAAIINRAFYSILILLSIGTAVLSALLLARPARDPRVLDLAG